MLFQFYIRGCPIYVVKEDDTCFIRAMDIAQLLRYRGVGPILRKAPHYITKPFGDFKIQNASLSPHCLFIESNGILNVVMHSKHTHHEKETLCKRLQESISRIRNKPSDTPVQEVISLEELDKSVTEFTEASLGNCFTALIHTLETQEENLKMQQRHGMMLQQHIARQDERIRTLTQELDSLKKLFGPDPRIAQDANPYGSNGQYYNL